MLLSDKLFIAVRRGSLNVYHRGMSLFRIDEGRDGTISPKIHIKFLVRNQQALAELQADGTFSLPQSAPEICWARYEPGKTLPDIITAAANFAGPEKAGLHSLIMRHSNVIDVEASLARTDNDDSTKQDRLDAITLEPQQDGIALVFHEAKHFTNADLREPSDKPRVVDQLSRYRQTIEQNQNWLRERYQATCENRVRIHTMQSCVRADQGKQTRQRDSSVQQVADRGRNLIIDPEPRLIIYGFDDDQKKGRLSRTIQTLEQAGVDGRRIYAVGNLAKAEGAFRPIAP